MAGINIKKRVVDLITMELREEEEEEKFIINTLLKKRRSENELFKTRESEGCFKLLISNHLDDNELKFKEYFRLTKNQFIFILDLIKEDVAVLPSFRVKHPISEAEKLAICIRYSIL